MNLHYPPHLPIVDKKDDIINALKKHQVVVIAGDTGSGKTTQLPKMCLEAELGKKGRIGCTQPRRIAALSVADRVAEELGDSHHVGSKVRFHDRTSEETLIKFMTDGILLAETRHDRDLRQYDAIIIDEAHERSLNIDFLLGYLCQLCQRRNDLTVVISSATIDTEKFSRHFNTAPIIEVSGRTYPISYQYIDEASQNSKSEQTLVEQAVEQTCFVADSTSRGDILVFMPTERDIMDTVEQLHKQLVHPAQILPLFGRLHGKDQRKIFQSSKQRKIIVATNIAETSLTVPGIRFVIDTGLARISHYNSRTGTTSLPVSKVSRASCDQRAGRCGRTGPGNCIRLYSEEDYIARPEFTQPELLRSNLAEVILQMISLRLGDPGNFPFIDPPASRAIHDGYRTLRELGAISQNNMLTPRGRIMAGLPLDPRISRMIIEGAELGALREVIIIAAVLSIQDPRIRPVDKKEQARQAQQIFIHKGSDFLTYINIWKHCRSAMEGKQPSAGLRKFCAAYFCSWQRMREWFDIHDQILKIIKKHKGFTLNNDAASPEAIHQALTAGFLRNIGLRKEKNRYQVSGNREVVLFPGSALYNKGGQWIVAADFVQTSQLFARTVATIDVQWLERLGGELCKRSWSEPHWHKKAGQVVARERVTLFGLIIVAARRVNYGRINKKTALEAREIFIREALVQGKLQGHYPFLQHNMETIRHFSDIEERMRKRGVIVDEQIIFEFYDKRLGMVYDKFTLNRTLKKKNNDNWLKLTEEDICQNVPDNDELYRFPKVLQTNQGQIKLHYRFDPGHPEDGVTALLPVHGYSSLQPSLFEWLVPGFLEEKIFYLLKGLPKNLRKHFVPIPDSVDQLMDGLILYQGTLYEQLERLIIRKFQVRIVRKDWQLDNLPGHLRMGFHLINEKGKVLHKSKSFYDLEPYTLPAAPLRKQGKQTLPASQVITSWTFDPAPQPIPILDKQQRITSRAYPVLQHDKKCEQLTLEYLLHCPDAVQRNRQGLRILYCREFSREIKAVRKECKAAVKNNSASWLSLGIQAKAADISKQLFESVLDQIFSLTGEELPNKNQFSRTIQSVKSAGFFLQARKVLGNIINLLTTRREVQMQLIEYKKRSIAGKSFAPQAFEEFQNRLDGLVPPTFLKNLHHQECQHLQRYLNALAKRIERAEYSLHKDGQKSVLIRAAEEKLEQIKTRGRITSECRCAIALYKQMLEEYRVSIFAPELGTAIPVSAKRLKQQWELLDNQCRTVE